MQFWKTILSLVRQRNVGPPVIALSIIAAAVVYFLVPMRYMSNATMILTTPPGGGTLSQDPNKPNGLTNPLLNPNDGLTTTATILIQSMNTPDEMNELGAQSGNKVVVNDGSTNPDLLNNKGPYVYVEVESATAANAHDTVTKAQQQIRDQLVRRQKDLGAPPSTYITVFDVVPASEPKSVQSNKIQGGVLVLGLGIVLGLGGAYMAQRLVASRRRRLDDEPLEDVEQPRPSKAQIDPPTIRIAPVSQPFNRVRRPANGSAHRPVKPLAPAVSLFDDTTTLTPRVGGGLPQVQRWPTHLRHTQQANSSNGANGSKAKGSNGNNGNNGNNGANGSNGVAKPGATKPGSAKSGGTKATGAKPESNGSAVRTEGKPQQQALG